jgi:hypothetical protein
MKRLKMLLLLSGITLLLPHCIPPRCKIPNCTVVIDHNHAYGTRETEGRKTQVAKVYRGVPFFAYVFRKKYRAQNSMGYYRKIDTREAYKKSIHKKNYVEYKKKSKKKKEKPAEPTIPTENANPTTTPQPTENEPEPQAEPDTSDIQPRMYFR